MSGFLMPHFSTWEEEQQWAHVHLPSAWPNLTRVGFGVDDVTSPHTADYNCIAYAAKDETVPWWPVPESLLAIPGNRFYYWPVKRVYPATVENFYEAFATLGFEPCKSGKREPGYEKVAIYVDAAGEIQHMARELGDGVWHSKLGDCQDIRHHTPEGAQSDDYGEAKYFMRKPVEGYPRWKRVVGRILTILSNLKSS